MAQLDDMEKMSSSGLPFLNKFVVNCFKSSVFCALSGKVLRGPQEMGLPHRGVMCYYRLFLGAG